MILAKQVIAQDAGINWVQSNSINTNVFALCITSTGRIIASFFGNGIWYSDDNGVNWTQSIETADAQRLCVTSTGRIIAVNIYYQSYILYSDDNGETWSQINLGIGFGCDVLYVLPTGQIIASGQDGTYRSSDHGANWTRLDSDSNKFYFREICCTATGRLIAGQVNKWGIWYSDDNGETWTQSNKRDHEWSGLCITKTGRIIAANTDYGWLYSDNNGETWSQINSSNMTSGRVTYTGVTSNGRIVAICNDYINNVFSVWYSDDNGVNWTQAQQSIETQEPWQVICITNTGRIVIGGYDIGVYYSDPVYTMQDTYMSKPLTGAQARQLVAECKAYVQELKQS